MATEVERLVVLMEANAAGMARQLEQAQRIADKRLESIERRFDRTAKNASASFTNMAKAASVAIAAIGVGSLIQDASKLADAWTNAGNKLRGLGLDAGAVAGKQSELADLAVKTQTSYAATVDLYSTILRAQENLNIGERDRLAVVETINKAISLGGASASQASAVVLQLGQALGSGVLQGDEFKSLRENSQILTNAIAAEFGVTTSELKKLAANGELTSDRIIKAFLKVKPLIDAAFKSTNTTVAAAFENLNTRITQFVGKANEATGATKSMAEIINFTANNLDAFAHSAVIAASVLSGGLIAAGVVPGAVALTRFAVSGQAAAATLGALQLAAVGGARAVASLNAALVFMGGPIGLAITALGAAIAYVAITSTNANVALQASMDVSKRLEPLTERLAKLELELAGATDDTRKAIEGKIRAVKDEMALDYEAAKAKVAKMRAAVDAANAEIKAGEELDRAGNHGAGVLGQVEGYARLAVAQRALRQAQAEALASFGATRLPELDAEAERLAAAGRGKGKDKPGGAAGKTVADLKLEHELNLARINDDKALIALREDQAEIAKRTAAYRAADTKLTQEAARAIAESEVSMERLAEATAKQADADKALKERATEFANRAEGASANLRAELTELKGLIDSGILRGLGREADAVQSYIDGQVELARVTGDSAKAIENMRAVAGATNEQLERGANRAKKEAEAYRATRDDELQKPFRYDEIRDDVKGALRQAFETGDWADAFKDKLQGALTRALDRSLDRFVDGLFDAMSQTGSSGGGGGNWISGAISAIGKFFGGGKANGGPVSPGMFYRVNENTPNSEWFAPKVPGTIFPSLPQIKVPSGGGAAPIVTVQGNTYNFKGTGEEIAQFRAEAARMEASRPAQILAVMRDAQRRRIG